MKRLVLVGGGHAHLHVVREWRRAWPTDRPIDVVLASDRAHSVYSGMLPGWLAGEYDEREISIDLARLCAASGVRFTRCTAVSIDAARRRIETQCGGATEWIDYDVASFDVGSDVAGLDAPALRAHAIPARPVAGLIARLRDLRASLLAGDAPADADDVAVVGGGAAGVELALALRRLWPSSSAVRLIEAGERLLPGYADRVAAAAAARCRAAGLTLHVGSPVAGVVPAPLDRGPRGLRLASGDLVPATRWLWVTGAAAPALFARSDLATDAAGFLRVNATLESASTAKVFAAGDCASLDHAPETPKSGVHAVRAGPVLLENLLARLSGRPLTRYEPQRDALALLNLADGTALGTKWGLVAQGRWVRFVKDRIDRRFVARYQR